MEWIINQPVVLGFVGSATGIASFPDKQVLKDGVVEGIGITTTEVGSKLYTATFTPTATGIYTLFIDGSIQATINVVNRLSRVMLGEILDEALGSWEWNKSLGTLTLFKQTGGTLATFNVIDGLTIASRERV
jgi:hypothetical protein